MEECDPSTAEIAELVETWPGFPADCWGPISEEQITEAERELAVFFPKSYRTFLRRYGAGSVGHYEIFGLPGDHLWGNVVVMNQGSRDNLPRHYMQFMESVGEYTYYLDTSRTDAHGECPVVVFGAEE